MPAYPLHQGDERIRTAVCGLGTDLAVRTPEQTTALDALHQAHQAWIRTQPQLFFELGLDETHTPHSWSEGTTAALPAVRLIEPDGSQVAPGRAAHNADALPSVRSAAGTFVVPSVPSTTHSGPTATTRESLCAVGPQGGAV